LPAGFEANQALALREVPVPSSPQDGPFGPGWIKGKKRLKGEESKPVPTDPAEPTTPELSFPWVCKRSRQSTEQQCKSAEDLLLGGTQSLEIKTKVTKGSQERRRSRKSIGASSDDADALSALSELFSE